jgi:hypothetical protein
VGVEKAYRQGRVMLWIGHPPAGEGQAVEGDWGVGRRRAAIVELHSCGVRDISLEGFEGS